jgi:hypothetical protein
MTPLQVIVLAHKMRQAQKAFNSALRGESPLMDRHTVMIDLENQFDAAIEPYINYARSFEMQEEGNDDQGV